MKKSIKSIIAAVMSACVALSGPACYAGRGGNKRPNKNFFAKELMSGSCREEDSAERQLRELQLKVDNLVSAGGNFDPFPDLRSELIPLENRDILISKFSEFFMNFIKNKRSAESGSAKSVYDVTILFLSIVNRLRSLPGDDRDAYLRIALLALDMCSTQGESMYRRWYTLLELGTQPIPRNMRKIFFDFRIRWHAHWLELIKNAYAYSPVVSDMLTWLVDSVTKEQLHLLTFPVVIEGPLLTAARNAEEAMESIPRLASPKDIARAAKAIEEYGEAIKKSSSDPFLRDDLAEHRSKQEAMQRHIGRYQGMAKDVQSGCHDIEVLTEAAVHRMLSEKSPESIRAARDAVDRYRDWAVKLEPECVLITSAMRNKESSYNELINWVKNFLEFIHPHMVAADEAVRGLSKTSSDESFKAALAAQEGFEKALDEHGPESSCPEFMRAIGLFCEAKGLQMVTPVVEPEIVEDFALIRKHFDENQRLIADLQAAREVAAEAERCERERKERSDEWAAKVASGRQSKEEEKSRKMERAESPKEVESHDVVFFHGPETTDSLKFLTDHSRYIPTWNNWYKNAQKGELEGDPMTLQSIPIFENKTGRDLGIYQKDGHPVIYEYKGGGAAKNKSQGLRIVYYVEKDSNRVVILYIGEPFGEIHNNPWKTLVMTPEWEYERVNMISK